MDVKGITIGRAADVTIMRFGPRGVEAVEGGDPVAVEAALSDGFKPVSVCPPISEFMPNKPGAIQQERRHGLV
jgi:hypothetical protein